MAVSDAPKKGKASGRPLTWDHLKSTKKGATRTVTIIPETDVLDEYEDAKAAYETLNEAYLRAPTVERLTAERDQAEERRNQAQAAVEACSLKFVLRSIGRKRFEELVSDNPPTPEQTAKAKEEADKANKRALALGQEANADGELAWDPDKFPPALLAACLVEPAITEEQAQELWVSPDWSAPEQQALFMAALAVNSDSRQVDLGKGFGRILAFGQS